MEDMDVRTVTQLCGYLLLGSSFVTDQADDQVLLLFRELLEELELDRVRPGKSVCHTLTGWRLTPIPLDTPVIT